jgi:archaellum biogenesis ATPase FlaH
MAENKALLAERSIFELLTDIYSLDIIVLEGFKSKWLPTADIRFIFDWAVEQYQLTGNLYAPTHEMFEGSMAPGYKKSLADVLKDNNIDVTEVSEQPVEWCIQELKANHLRVQTLELIRDLSAEVSESMAAEMAPTVIDGSSKLTSLTLDLESRRTSIDMVAEADDIVDRYLARAANPGFKGMTMGIAEVDEYTHGIDYGELAVLAGPEKSGKSWVADYIALKELQQGHSVCLVTLENGMDMTIDRIACIATGIDPTRFKAGVLTSEEFDALVTWKDEVFKPIEEQLWIVKPMPGDRTPEAILSKARTRKVDSLIIDQLLWMEDVDERSQLKDRIRDRMTKIKGMIESNSHPMPCLLLHQVNRTGIEAAKKAGRLYSNDMAEGAAVEQGVDWLFSLWQSEDMKVANTLLLQTLACRREAIKNWDIYFDLENGVFRYMNETSV